MATRILIIGNDRQHLETSRIKLCQAGFAVAICGDGNIVASIEKLKPEVIFIHTRDVNDESTGLYNDLVDNVRYAALPVIFTLSEDDVYLVNRKRMAAPDKRSVIAPSAIEAVHTALEYATSKFPSDLSFHDIRMLYRA